MLVIFPGVFTFQFYYLALAILFKYLPLYFNILHVYKSVWTIRIRIYPCIFVPTSPPTTHTPPYTSVQFLVASGFFPTQEGCYFSLFSITQFNDTKQIAFNKLA